jgi:uncharacterized peroxidase-related enzyme
MPRIAPVDAATATGAAATHLATTRKLFGSVPNMFATAAQSPVVLEAMLGMFGSLGKASIGARAGEQIAIAVAQENGCGYCLSAHTAIGKKHGVTVADLDAARTGRAHDPKIAALLTLAVAVNRERGHVDDALLAEVRGAGVTDAEIVEVVAHVALNVFTNSLNNVAGTDIDFPKVALSSAA